MKTGRAPRKGENGGAAGRVKAVCGLVRRSAFVNLAGRFVRHKESSPPRQDHYVEKGTFYHEMKRLSKAIFSRL
jgi:hypothetical protein